MYVCDSAGVPSLQYIVRLVTNTGTADTQRTSPTLSILGENFGAMRRWRFVLRRSRLTDIPRGAPHKLNIAQQFGVPGVHPRDAFDPPPNARTPKTT